MPSFQAKDLSAWSGGAWSGDPPARITGVSTDTRTLRPGELYVALRGPRFDGHAFAAEAFARGAAAAMGEGALGPAAGPWLRVPDTRKALADLASAYRRTLGARLIGVTGSVGKTTVKEMTADVLASSAPTARTRGNWNNDIGLPLSLLATEAADRYGVFEMGTNHPGEIAALCRCLQPGWGLITAVGPGHLEHFASVKAIAREKADLLRALPPDGLAFLPRDDAWYDLLRAAAPCPVVSVGWTGEADFRALPSPAGETGFIVAERATGEQAALSAPLPGRYMAVDALFAVAVGRRCGLSWESIRKALGRYQPLPLRWNRSTVRGVEFINDAYNANPLSMRAALDAFAGLAAAGRRWLVLGGMLELGPAECDLHRRLGREVAAGPWAGLVAVGSRGGWMVEGAREAGMAEDHLFCCPDAESAAAQLKSLVRPGDAVLLKASRAERMERVQEMYAAP